jgi:anti-sigma factor RsiW
MLDCPNAEVRDRLPDLVHGQLAGEELAEVERHVAACAACAAELALIREVRSSLRAETEVRPSIVAASVRSRLRPAGSARRVGGSRFSRGVQWRVAAGIALLIGASYLATTVAPGAGDGGGGARASDGMIGSIHPGSGAVQSVASAELSFEVAAPGISESELLGLAREIDAFDGLPPEIPGTILSIPDDMTEVW